MRVLLLVVLFSVTSLAGKRCETCARDSHGRILRTYRAKHQFRLTHPCPGTGRTTGACKGYVIDHIVPLECGGADNANQMQWQTVAEAKAKDKTEGNCTQNARKARKAP